jgi:AbrB family looped-hinge helix DNA binding protein
VGSNAVVLISKSPQTALVELLRKVPNVGAKPYQNYTKAPKFHQNCRVGIIFCNIFCVFSKNHLYYIVGIVGKVLLTPKGVNFMPTTMTMPVIDSAKVLPKGQITIPKDFREQLNINTGDRLTLICKEDRLILMNPAVFALKEFQEAMEGEAEKAGLRSDDDVIELIMQMRREEDEA